MLWSEVNGAASHSFRELLLELARERSLDDLLPLCTRRLVENEDVALARLWLLERGDQCAGCPNARCAPTARCACTWWPARRARATARRCVDGRLDGAFRRIPLGAFKVGAVAATRAPVLVTDPAHDPKIRHPEWVRAEGIAGFAGLPLLSRGELLGVLGVFVRAPLTDRRRRRACASSPITPPPPSPPRAPSPRSRRCAAGWRWRTSCLRRTVQAEPIALCGHSAQLRAVLHEIAAVAATDATVLVLGESGTGKELAAQAIHQQSRRAAGPFIEVNCAAIPRELSESELFGHVRGAFSGATRDRVGRFEAAAGGTLFLDEIGELPPDLQGKLLRVLQEGTFERVGEVRARRSDVRIVAATNRNLHAEVDAGRFRQDLYYRLAVYPITMPPLRERREDIPELAIHLLERICRRLGRPTPALTPEQLEALMHRDWPGNVRELLNVLERATISSSSADGGPGLHLPAFEPASQPALRAAAVAFSVPALEGPAFTDTRGAEPPQSWSSARCACKSARTCAARWRAAAARSTGPTAPRRCWASSRRRWRRASSGCSCARGRRAGRQSP